MAIQVAEKIKLSEKIILATGIMIPFEKDYVSIWDHYGNPIGFTSRSTKDGQQPKYLNSTESFIFKKAATLCSPPCEKCDSRA